jgi:succinate dehydrogenase / fumarate reductase membrane anchor subunit
MSSRLTPRIGFSFEYIMWIFTRISGVVLILLALIGVSAAFVMGARTQMDAGTLARWMFFPNPNHVVNSDIPDVAMGWANAYWQIMQMLFVFFGGTHGINGIRMVIEDYVSVSWLRIFLRSLLFIVWLFMMIVAVYVILAS